MARIANAVGEHVVETVKQLSPLTVNGTETVEATIIRPAAVPTAPTSPKAAQNLALGLTLDAGQVVLPAPFYTKIS